MILSRRQRFEYQFCRDCDRRFERAINRTSVGEVIVDAACCTSVRLLGLQFQDDMDAADHKHLVI